MKLGSRFFSTWEISLVLLLSFGACGSVGLAGLAAFKVLSTGQNRRDSFAVRGITTAPLLPTPTFSTGYVATKASAFLETLVPLPIKTSEPGQAVSPTPPPTITATKTPVILSEAYVNGVQGHAQLSTLDCESRSAADWAAFFGVQIDEMEFLGRLPRSDNPDEGFVGNYFDPQGQIPPHSYGVHAPPVAALLTQYGVNAHAWKNASWQDIQREISSSRPVIAWVMWNTSPGAPLNYTDHAGQNVIVARFEHTVIVTGYTPETVTILDGDQLYYRSINEFMASWSVLGNMMITNG